MIYEPMTGALYANDGTFLKTVRCPLALHPSQLGHLPGNGTADRSCSHCNKTIRNIDDYSDDELQTAISEDNTLCIFATSKAKNVTFLQSIGIRNFNYSNAPVIQTMRSLEAMADAQAKGYTLIFKNVSCETEQGDTKYIVYQNTRTGKLWWSNDYRESTPYSFGSMESENDWKLVHDWFFSRPDRPFPLAAYAIPTDLKPQSDVYIEDLIEDSFVEVWNQGNSVRQISSAAVWTGSELVLQANDDGGPAVIG